MKYEDFIAKAKELSLADDRYDDKNYRNKYDEDYEDHYYQTSYYGRRSDVKIETPRLYVTYETGGYRGGSCWGGTAEPYV